MSAALRMIGLSKRYGHSPGHRALQDLDLTVERGEIFGFLGPNGAGKSTTIRILMGLLRPTGGRAEILGLDTWLESTGVRGSVGYLPGDVRFRERQTGRQILRLFAKLRGVPNGYDALAERLDLDLDRPVRAYSKGMKQKLGLIQALMHDPEIIILDEPTSGLDPFTQKKVNELLRERREAGATLFFSSHVLPEVEEMCDRVALLLDGRLLRCAALHELRELQQRRFELALPTASAAESVLVKIQGLVSRAEVTGRTLVGHTREVGKLLDLFQGLDLDGLKLEGLRLEDLFYQLYSSGQSAIGKSRKGARHA